MDTAYYGEILTINPEESNGTRDIEIIGRAVDRSDGQPLAEVPLILVITFDGFERSDEVYTGSDGSFTYAFEPTPGQYGEYKVCAIHPDLMDRPVQGRFTIAQTVKDRIGFSPASYQLTTCLRYERQIEITVTAGSEASATNLGFVYEASDQEEETLPQGIHVDTGDPVAELGPGETQTITITLWANNTAEENTTITLRLVSDEAPDTGWGELPIRIQTTDTGPVVTSEPNRIETGLSLDQSITETLTLKNMGFAPLVDPAVSLVNRDGTPAPGWVLLNLPSDMDAIEVGESVDATVLFSPTQAEVSEGEYYFYIQVQGANYAAVNIPVHAVVTSSGTGHILFKVSDIYTGTIDEKTGKMIQGLPGAALTLQNESAASITYSGGTDQYGELLLSDIPAGRYKYILKADDHEQSIGRVWIKPGITATQDVFLNNTLVTVEWSVVETGIQDQYEIVLKATYETNVPAPVVVADPLSVSLAGMSPGDVLSGEIRFTNYGLIRADNIEFAAPSSDQYFKYEFLDIPATIEAKESVNVAYRVTCLSSLTGEDEGNGGGAGSYSKSGKMSYSAKCYSGSISVNFNVPGTGSGGDWTMPWGSASSTGFGRSSEIPEGVKCWPGYDREEPSFLNAPKSDQIQCVLSSVNMLHREYNRHKTDIRVKVPGGTISFERRYYDNQWHLDYLDDNLTFQSTGSDLIIKNDVKYKPVANDSRIFIHKNYKITTTDTGYTWKAPHGDWKKFDPDGRMISYGDRNGLVAQLIYEDGENGRLTGIADKNMRQIFWFEYDGEGNLAAVEDFERRRIEYSHGNGLLTDVQDLQGNTTSYEYDDENRIIKTTTPDGHYSTVVYDEYGNAIQSLDENNQGYGFEYAYDESARLSYAMTTSPSGQVKEAWYDLNGYTRRVDINGRTVKTIDVSQRTFAVTDENGNVTIEEYDEWENLIRMAYPDGSEVTYEYERTYNQPVRMVNENGVATLFEYDDNGNLTQKTEAAGTDDERITQYTYDEDGNTLTITILADAVTSVSQTVMTYDDNGNLETLTDPAGGITRFTDYDITGRLLTKIDARGKTWGYTYDTKGNLKTATDPLGNTTEYEYDKAGNRTRMVDALGRQTLFEYDLHGNLVLQTDHEVNETRFEYDAGNNLIRKTDAQGSTTQSTYDTEGRMVSTVDGHGDETAFEYNDTDTGCSSCNGSRGLPSRIIYPTFTKTFTYDRRNRKTAETDHLNDTTETTTLFEYDSAGNLAAKTDKEGRTTAYTYDALNRITKVIDPANGETIYEYDDRDNLISLTDAENQTTLFEYDAANRLVKETRPLGNETTYAYDDAGNLTEKIDAKNQKTEYNYDDAGRLKQIRYIASSTGTAPAKTVTFSYDKTGNLTGYNDGTTSADYTYNTLNQKVKETVNYGAFSLETGTTYYGNGLKKTQTGPDGTTYGYLYDTNNQLSAVQVPNAGYITIGEYLWNRPKSLLFPGGSQRTVEYDPLMRIKQITGRDQADNQNLSLAYEYDKMDNITAKATEHGSYAYEYDTLYRLTNTDNPVLDNEAFTYDNVGNRMTSAETSAQWSYNQNNELAGYDNVTFTHDANGNIIEKNNNGTITRFYYNIENRLERMENESGTVIAEYYYDPFGRRLWKDVSGTRTCYHYTDEGLAGEYNAAGNAVKTYGYKPGGTWGTDPLFMKVGPEYYFYHNDHLGTPQKMTAVNGAVVWSATYSSFGEAEIDPASTVENNLRFPGQYYDSETGIHYNFYRYYNPETGRYITTDPIGFEGGFNLFVYVLNNPSGWIDPMGLNPYKWGYCGPGYRAGPGRECWPTDDPKYQCPPGYYKAGKECFPKTMDEYPCGAGRIDDGHGSCVKVWPPPSPKSEEKGAYCEYGNRIISCTLDAASVVATVTGAGVPVGITINVISVGHGFIAWSVCGGSTSTGTTIVGGVAGIIPNATAKKINLAMTAIDAALNVAGY